MYGSLLTKWNIGEVFNGALINWDLINPIILFLLWYNCNDSNSLAQRSGSVREKLYARPDIIRYAAYVGLFVSIIVFGAYGIGYDSNQFIYNQF